MPVILMIVLLMLIGGCAQDPKKQGLDVSEQHRLAEPKIEFLGVGGWLLHWRGEGLLLAPSFSNPSLFGLPGIPPLWVAADEQKIDRLMPQASDVTMLLVGHGHYDHLLDVPWIMQTRTPEAFVYGSTSVAHMLRGMMDPMKIVDAQPAMATFKDPAHPAAPLQIGQWIYSRGTHLRAMPIQSEHAGHVLGINLIPGSYYADLAETPLSLWRWKPGQTMAWLIDLLDDDGRTVYRLHYQDSAATPPYGFPPVIQDGKGIDVEILCVGSWIQVDHYPQQLLEWTKPRMVLLGHWEDFFGNDPLHPQTLGGQDERSMVAVVRSTVGPGVPVYMPAPLSEIALPPPQPSHGN